MCNIRREEHEHLHSARMGGAVSSGNSNEELVDNLCHEDYITRPEVEKVFRKVDRADYMTFQEGKFADQ